MHVVCCLIWEVLTVTARLASAEERRSIVALFLKGINSDFKNCAAHLLGIQCPEARLVCEFRFGICRNCHWLLSNVLDYPRCITLHSD